MLAFLDPVIVHLRLSNCNNVVNIDDILVLINYIYLTIFCSTVCLDMYLHFLPLLVAFSFCISLFIHSKLI